MLSVVRSLLYLYLALLAYFLNALSFVVDKYLLSSPIPRPFAYAFWVSILSASAVILVPFGIIFPSLEYFLYAILSGGAFFTALIFFYWSVKKGDVTVTATNTGVFTVLLTYVFSYLMLGEYLSHVSFYGYALMLVGLLFLGWSGRSLIHYSLGSGASFALSFVLLKLVFNYYSEFTGVQGVFINGIFWTRVGFVIAALLPLLTAGARHEISASFSQAPPKSRLVFVGNKLLVGCGFLTLYYAISIGDVVIVNSLMGFQFVFILLLTVLTRRWLPRFASASERPVTSNKVLGVLFVVVGFLAFIVNR